MSLLFRMKSQKCRYCSRQTQLTLQTVSKKCPSCSPNWRRK